MTSIDYQLLKSSFKESIRQAGAELCRAQGKLVWFDISLKFSWSCSLAYFFLRTVGSIEVIIILSQLSDVAVVEAVAEFGNSFIQFSMSVFFLQLLQVLVI